MNRIHKMALGVSLAIAGSAGSAAAQVVLVDVGIGTPGFGARVVWGSPRTAVYTAPVLIYEPEPVYYYPAPYRIVYYQSWPVAYWEYVRVHDPHRYARFRSWMNYERSYQHAWRAHDRVRYDELRTREARYFRERLAAERGFREWKRDRVRDRDRDWRRDRDDDHGRGRGRGRR